MSDINLEIPEGFDEEAFRREALERQRNILKERQATEEKFRPLPTASYLKGNKKGELVKEDVVNNKKFLNRIL